MGVADLTDTIPPGQPAGHLIIGVDVGGTHTDLCAVSPQRTVRAKSFTTHEDYSNGIVNALSLAAERLDLRLPELMSRCDRMVVGTTIVTNAVTELRGAKVGLLVTRGFGDILRLLGGVRKNVYDDHQQTNPRVVVERENVVEIDERVDVDGHLQVRADEDQLRSAVRLLRGRGVEAIAVCFLWSFKDSSNEELALKIIQDEWPEVFTTLSSRLHPVLREHERLLTTVFNCFSQPAAKRLLDTLDARLASEGFTGQLSYFAGAGGSIDASVARVSPILLLGSGPAGGVAGTAYLAEQMGVRDVITGDMGGTSFDTCLIQDLQPQIVSRVALEEFETGLSLVDVVSIGAGGGSIGWIDPRGVPQVGPHSAGSRPGPACYGNGGILPTITDSAVAMSLIDVDGYLGGRVNLDRGASLTALRSVFEGPFGWNPEQAAEAMFELSATNMAHALRHVSLERGLDPRQYLFCAFGGTLPLLLTRICDKLGLRRAVVPNNSSVFSAFGVLTADYVRRYTKTVEWFLDDEQGLARVNAVRDELLEWAAADVALSGLELELKLAWSAECRFQGQTYEIGLPLPDGELGADDAQALITGFPGVYERHYGTGTAWRGTRILMLNLVLVASAEMPKPHLVRAAEGDADSSSALVGTRPAWMSAAAGTAPVDIYKGSLITPGMKVVGPAIIDEDDTTLVVQESWTARRDGLFSYVFEKA
jgi:N-methylhydantoinase A